MLQQLYAKLLLASVNARLLIINDVTLSACSHTLFCLSSIHNRNILLSCQLGQKLPMCRGYQRCCICCGTQRAKGAVWPEQKALSKQQLGLGHKVAPKQHLRSKAEPVTEFAAQSATDQYQVQVQGEQPHVNVDL